MFMTGDQAVLRCQACQSTDEDKLGQEFGTSHAKSDTCFEVLLSYDCSFLFLVYIIYGITGPASRGRGLPGSVAPAQICHTWACRDSADQFYLEDPHRSRGSDHRVVELARRVSSSPKQLLARTSGLGFTVGHSDGRDECGCRALPSPRAFAWRTSCLRNFRPLFVELPGGG
ncbi:hypothetical protein TREES_T100018754 [Tupaia chinensis]|uniref:Uncharacterized protein n=1 Tax=Tupaia chinensis TaxID=246437 RepID=L9KJ10_TUPCH|nr:hypothetical protein TREES_T100018754 [Tupaia chinensis]